MLDMNRLLTQVLGANPNNPADAGRDRESSEHAVRSFVKPTLSRPSSSTPGPEIGPAMGYAGALGAGALAGGLAGLLFGSKRTREVAGTALQIGAVAAIGGLAYKAYQNYRQGLPVVPQAVAGTRVEYAQQCPEDDLTVQTDAVPIEYRSPDAAHLLLRTMIAAASADGHLDQVEYGRIRQQLLASGLNEEEQFFLSQLIVRPNSVSELAAAATTPELRVEVYAAARLAIDRDLPVEREWLDKLATALDLEPGLKAHLDAINSPNRLQAA